jgi:hypothetical protein
MTLADLGSLGEFLGSIAVLVTLIYIALQTKQTKTIAVAEAARTMSADFLSVWKSLGEDEEFGKVCRKGLNDWSAINRDEQLRVHNFLISMMIHYIGTTRSSHKALEESYLAWENNLLGILSTAGGQTWWESAKYLWEPSVRDHLEARLADPSTLPPPWTIISWWREENENSDDDA